MKVCTLSLSQTYLRFLKVFKSSFVGVRGVGRFFKVFESGFVGVRGAGRGGVIPKDCRRRGWVRVPIRERALR